MQVTAYWGAHVRQRKISPPGKVILGTVTHRGTKIPCATCKQLIVFKEQVISYAASYHTPPDAHIYTQWKEMVWSSNNEVGCTLFLPYIREDLESLYVCMNKANSQLTECILGNGLDLSSFTSFPKNKWYRSHLSFPVIAKCFFLWSAGKILKGQMAAHTDVMWKALML